MYNSHKNVWTRKLKITENIKRIPLHVITFFMFCEIFSSALGKKILDYVKQDKTQRANVYTRRRQH